MNHHKFVSLNKKATISPLRQRENPKKRMKIKKKKFVETGKGNQIPRRLSKKVEADTEKLVHKRMSLQVVFLS